MQGKFSIARIMNFIILVSALLVSGCAASLAKPAARLLTAPTPNPDHPSISVVTPNRTELPRYESLELSVALKAKYNNPYDLRQVSLDGIFSGPEGVEMKVPGFWDGEATWRVRFTPSQAGQWTYQLKSQAPSSRHHPVY